MTVRDETYVEKQIAEVIKNEPPLVVCWLEVARGLWVKTSIPRDRFLVDDIQVGQLFQRDGGVMRPLSLSEGGMNIVRDETYIEKHGGLTCSACHAEIALGQTAVRTEQQKGALGRSYHQECCFPRKGRSDVPELIAEVRRLREELTKKHKTLEKAYTALRHTIPDRKNGCLCEKCLDDIIGSVPETQRLHEENEALWTALHDAIRRPMGVVPESAERLISELELEEAEERRPKG